MRLTTRHDYILYALYVLLINVSQKAIHAHCHACDVTLPFDDILSPMLPISRGTGMYTCNLKILNWIVRHFVVDQIGCVVATITIRPTKQLNIVKTKPPNRVCFLIAA